MGIVLTQWLHAAATTRVGGGPVISPTWTLMELEEDRVIEWYDNLLEAFALTPIPTAPASPTSVMTHPAIPATTPANGGGKRYLEMERHRIFKYCGVPGPWAGLTDEVVPEFVKGPVDYRAKKASDVRFYVEGFADRTIEGHGKDCFIHSAQLINDLRYFNLDRYESRSKGFSIFALAPFTDVGSIIRLRDEFIAHETADQHYVGDKRDLAALNQLHAEWPGDRETAYRWADHFTANVRRFLGENCPMLESLYRIIQALSDPAQFTDWDMRDYWCVMWMLHKATRRFFLSTRPNDTVLIEEVARNLESTIPYNQQVLPREMRTPAPRDGVEKPALKKAKVARRAPFVATFKAEMERAKAASSVAGTPFHIGNLLTKDPTGETLLGPEFCKLVGGSRKPCMRYFVGGDCGHGEGCSFSHEMQTRPTKNLLDAINKRLGEAVNALSKSLGVHPKV